MENNKVQVLVSCMHLKDMSIINRMNIQTDAVIVNQCNEDSIVEIDFKNDSGITCYVKIINTIERGLSKSRNMAIRNASDNCICLLCDDDEVLYRNYESLILEGYKSFSNADVVAFALNWNGFGKKFSKQSFKLSLLETLRVCSVQITFKSNSIKENMILFDELLGSGTGNGAGEEHRFMLDCRKKHLNMYYFPNIIASINIGESQWFKGFNEKYFRNYGWTSYRIFKQRLFSFLIILYYGISKYRLYKKEITMCNAIYYMLKGSYEKRN